MEYAAALEFLNGMTNYEKDASAAYPEAFRLERMTRLMRRLGNPQNAYESVIIAGSKGKGSVATLLSSILRMDNYRVGLYTSPHLADLRERIRVNGLMIGETHFAEALTRIEKVCEEPYFRKDPPTYFEALTAAAFCHFKELKTQIAVLEVGLGGLYDSTNVAAAKVVGIAPISLEHTDKLGRTLSKIAVQKCGVIKGREWVVCAPQPKEVEIVIEEAVREREADLWQVGKDIRIFGRGYDDKSQDFDLKGVAGDVFGLRTELLGAYQIENAALAVGLARALGRRTRLTVSDAAIRQGVLDARWPGRLEKVLDQPRVVLDGAHNPDSIRKMLCALKRHYSFGRLIAVLGVSNDKDLSGILDELRGECSALIATEARHPRARAAAEIAEAARDRFDKVLLREAPGAAVKEACSLADADSLVVICGSLFLIEAARKAVLEAC